MFGVKRPCARSLSVKRPRNGIDLLSVNDQNSSNFVPDVESTYLAMHFPFVDWPRNCLHQVDSMKSRSPSSAEASWFETRLVEWSRRVPFARRALNWRQGRCPWSDNWTKGKDQAHQRPLPSERGRESFLESKRASRLECKASWRWQCRCGCIVVRTVTRRNKNRIEGWKKLWRYLEEHWADKRHLPVDWRTAEDVTSSERQRHVLNHLGKELEVFSVAHEVKYVVNSAEWHENVLEFKEKFKQNLLNNCNLKTGN